MNVIPSKKKIKDEFVVSEKDGKREVDPRPEFEVNVEEFPDIKNWKTGEKYTIMMEVQQVGSMIGEYGDDKGKLVARFKVNGICSHDEKMENEEEEDEKDENGEYKGFPKAMRIKK